MWITCRLHVKFYARVGEHEKTSSDRSFEFIVVQYGIC